MAEQGTCKFPTFGSPDLSRDRGPELVAVADVVVLFVRGRGEHHADRAGGEVDQLAPDHRRHVEADVGAVEADGSAADAVVEDDLEAARNRDQQLP